MVPDRVVKRDGIGDEHSILDKSLVMSKSTSGSIIIVEPIHYLARRRGRCLSSMNERAMLGIATRRISKIAIGMGRTNHAGVD
jgi:hypothetical protein